MVTHLLFILTTNSITRACLDRPTLYSLLFHLLILLSSLIDMSRPSHHCDSGSRGYRDGSTGSWNVRGGHAGIEHHHGVGGGFSGGGGGGGREWRRRAPTRCPVCGSTDDISSNDGNSNESESGTKITTTPSTMTMNVNGDADTVAHVAKHYSGRTDTTIHQRSTSRIVR